ncbi:Ycf66 family protein [Trichothermofontia sp.]
MLPYILALVVAVGSLALYLSAFFFPETHRKGDIVFSGVGLFYALVLWVCANRFTGAALLGQTASVALLTWFGWQTLTLRRELVPSDRRTGFGPKTIQQGLGRLMGGLMQLPGDLAGAFSRSQPTRVVPPTTVPEASATPTEESAGTGETTVAPEATAATGPAVIPERPSVPAPAPPAIPTAIVDTPETVPSPAVVQPEAPLMGSGPVTQPTIAPEPELPETADLLEPKAPEEADAWAVEATDDVWEEDNPPAAETPSQVPAKPKRENVFAVLKDALSALSPFKKRPSRPMITLNRPESEDETAAESTVEPAIALEVEPAIEPESEAVVEAEVEPESEAVVEAEIAAEIAAEVPPGVEAGTESAGEAFAQHLQGKIAEVEPDQSEIEDWEAEPSPAVAQTTDALSEVDEAASNEPETATVETAGDGETDLGPDGAAAIAVSSEVEVAQSDLDVIDEPVPEAPIDVEASAVSETDDD